jgi:hypothetical protein
MLKGMGFLKNIFTVLIGSGLFFAASAANIQAPSFTERNVEKSDFFAKSIKSEKITEAWTYQFVFDNGTRAYINFATIIIPTSGKKIGCDISFYGFKGKNPNIGRQYPLERIWEFKDQNKISIKDEYVLEGLPGKGHRVFFSANKEDFGKFLLDVTFSSANKGKVPGDGNWKIGSAHYGAAILIPYGRVKGKIAFNSDTLEVKGYGYLEHTWQSGNPTDLAVRAFNLSEATRGAYAGRLALDEDGAPFGYIIEKKGDKSKILLPKEILENGKPYKGSKFPKAALQITWQNAEDTLTLDMSKPRQKFSMLENFDGWLAKKATKVMLGGEIFFWRGRTKSNEGYVYDWSITGF